MVMAMMKIMKIFIGTERQYLNGGPTEHIATVAVVGIVYPEYDPNDYSTDVHRTEHAPYRSNVYLSRNSV